MKVISLLYRAAHFKMCALPPCPLYAFMLQCLDTRINFVDFSYMIITSVYILIHLSISQNREFIILNQIMLMEMAMQPRMNMVMDN
jgi:hypothetical protein